MKNEVVGLDENEVVGLDENEVVGLDENEVVSYFKEASLFIEMIF